MFNNVKILILLVITLLIFWFLIVLFAILNPIGRVIVGLYKREQCSCNFCYGTWYRPKNSYEITKITDISSCRAIAVYAMQLL